MKTPKTDGFVMSKYASKDALYEAMRESHRSLEVQVQELREALEEMLDCTEVGALALLRRRVQALKVLERTK